MAEYDYCRKRLMECMECPINRLLGHVPTENRSRLRIRQQKLASARVVPEACKAMRNLQIQSKPSPRSGSGACFRSPPLLLKFIDLQLLRTSC